MGRPGAILPWLAAACWAALIFYFSSRPNLSTNLGAWDYILRKLAHMTVFGILCLLLWLAIRQHTKNPKTALVLAALISLVYAVTDEYHQTFVETRAGRVLDVGYDLAGILIITALLARFYLGRREEKKGPPAGGPHPHV